MGYSDTGFADPFQDDEVRSAELARQLTATLAHARAHAPAWAERLAALPDSFDPSLQMLRSIPVLRKPELMEAQTARPPFGGFAVESLLAGARLYVSPGPVFEPQAPGVDPWGARPALIAAGFSDRDTVINCFSYHLTPGAWILEDGVRAIGARIIPGGVGNTESQVEAARAIGATAYVGTPDFLKVLLDKASETGAPLAINKALVSGGALFPAMREQYRAMGVAVMQAYATADLGIVAYESCGADGVPLPGLVINENLILEIVRPGTDDPVPDGEVGEIVVTNFNQAYPMIRFGTGDLSKIVEGRSPCGRTNRRIAGWMGRADQRTKIKGMFVDPKQVAELMRRHPDVTRARLEVVRNGDADAMVLKVEAVGVEPDALVATLRDMTRLGGTVEIVPAGSLPNDGKIIDDRRDYSK